MGRAKRYIITIADDDRAPLDKLCHKLIAALDVQSQRCGENGMEPSWTAVDALTLFVMWSAMMIPGASPMITAFATINQRRRARAAPYVPTAAFLLGYLVAWIGFSVIATALQWLLQAAGLLTTMMQSSRPTPNSRSFHRSWPCHVKIQF